VADRDELMNRIVTTQRRLRDRMVQEGGAHPLLDANLTMSQLKVMIVLSRIGAMPAQDLAARIGASPATLSGIIDRLAAQDLVERHEDPQDRRVRKVDLTTGGHEMVDRLIAAGEQEQLKLFGRLDDQALGIVAEAFDLILEAAHRR
jgi:DNA-binding MarR family transcriptional regulator